MRSDFETITVEVETITFARFGVVYTLDVVGECVETGHPLVVLDGRLTGVSPIQVRTAEIMGKCKAK